MEPVHDVNEILGVSSTGADRAARGSQQQQEQEQHEPPQPAAWHNYSSVFTAAKAGMGGVDQDKVKQVVFEMSKDSAHFANEQRKQAQTDARIARLKAQAAQLTPAQLLSYQKACDAKVSLWEAGRQLSKVWLHVDMDAFYASVEERDQPSLKDKPMAVGGMGMICTANYLARKFGVRSAMPGFIAKKLCPQLVFVKPDFTKYTAASAEAFAVFRSYDERVQGASLDEAYLDVTGYCSAHGVTGEQVAAELRGKVVEATRGLTCSVGVAPNMMLAKIASDKNKPNGQCVVQPTRDDVMAFIAELPIRKLPGIGKVTEQVLQALGVSLCSDLVKHADLISALLSEISSSSLLQAGLGLGATEHSSRGGGPGSSEPGRKGISCERTFGAISTAAEMEEMLESLVAHLSSDMASEGIEAKTLTLKLKTTAFEVRTRAVTVPTYVSSASAMLPPLLKLLRAELPVSIRLMGVRGSNLRNTPQTLDTLAAEGKKLNALERMVLHARQQQQQQQQQQPQEQEQGRHQALQHHGEAQPPLYQQAQQEQQHVGLGPGHQQVPGQLWSNEQRGESLGQQFDWDGAEEEEEDEGEVQQAEEVSMWGCGHLPTQEQLQADFEEQCRQHQQQWQTEQARVTGGGANAATAAAAAAAMPAAAAAAGGSSVGAAAGDEWCAPAAPGTVSTGWCFDLQQQQHQQSDRTALQGGAPADLRQQPSLHMQQQQQQQQQQEVQQLLSCRQQEACEDSSLPPNKRQRQSAAQPAHHTPHTLAAAVPVAPPGHQWQQPGLVLQGLLAGQQQQQQPGLGHGHTPDGPCVQQSSWLKASNIAPHQQQQQQHPHQHIVQQQVAQQQQQHPYFRASSGEVDARGNAGDRAVVAGRTGGSSGAVAGSSSSMRSSSGSAPWTCLACTYSGNKQQWLRCSVCETPKGDTQPPLAMLAHHGSSGSSSAKGMVAAGAAGAVGSRGGAAGRSRGVRPGSSSGSKQLTLEHLGLLKQPGAG